MTEFRWLGHRYRVEFDVIAVDMQTGMAVLDLGRRGLYEVSTAELGQLVGSGLMEDIGIAASAAAATKEDA